MAESRPPIPAELKRRVLVEAGHRCAIHTCRHIEVDVHHIIPWITVKAHDYENLIALCPNCHRRADRGEIDRKALRLYKLNLRTAHDKFSQLEIDMLLALFNAGQGAQYPWMPYLGIFFNRTLDAGYLTISRAQGGVIRQMGVDVTPTYLSLTDAGRSFVQSLGLHEI
jgi:hypothetical protein